MKQVCNYGHIHWKTSPLCNNWELYNSLKYISNKKNVSFNLMIGISYAESHIWTNFNPQRCYVTNNWSGKKREKFDDGSNSPRFNHMSNWHKGCRLYTFDSVEHFWWSFANTLYYWYLSKGCNTPECISQWYVWWWGWVKQNRVNRVRLFYN